ncbi:hypothetical protein AVEN_266509-1 [Araneus ventricosus]|uniref:Uncharacterized protein n=1 Tax=Araneus ventricosus TaxID=182803 RepID=A0A4Y2W783_ARAVE|nr:hypothetical protein AVEN_266509-1 [Araneus ventricosus]
MKPLSHRVIRGSGGAGMTLDQFGCGDVLLNFAFPDFVIVEAIPGPLIHCEYPSSSVFPPSPLGDRTSFKYSLDTDYTKFCRRKPYHAG